MKRYISILTLGFACVCVAGGVPLLSLCWAGTHTVPNDQQIDCKDVVKHPCIGRTEGDCEGINETQVKPKPDGTKAGDGTATTVAMMECYRSVSCLWDTDEEECIVDPIADASTGWERWGTKYIPGANPPEE